MHTRSREERDRPAVFKTLTAYVDCAAWARVLVTWGEKVRCRSTRTPKKRRVSTLERPGRTGGGTKPLVHRRETINLDVFETLRDWLFRAAQVEMEESSVWMVDELDAGTIR